MQEKENKNIKNVTQIKLKRNIKTIKSNKQKTKERERKNKKIHWTEIENTKTTTAVLQNLGYSTAQQRKMLQEKQH